MATATVTPSERRRAQRQSRETARFQRKSSDAATRLGARMLSRSLGAWRRGDALAIRGIIDEEFKKVEPVLDEMTTIAYLTGLDRIRVAKQDVPIAAALHTEANRALSKRLQIDPAKLREVQNRQNVQAVRMLKRVQDDVDKKLQRAMVKVTQEGLTTREGTKVLRNAFAAAGVVPVNSFEIEAVFRTQTNFAYSAGSWEAANDPVIKDILWGYKYVTVGDDRVRDKHVLLDGTTAPKDHAIWQEIWPPNGWACRCQIIFVFEERETSLPEPEDEIDGRPVIPGPDEGFSFNPGTILQPGGSSVRKAQAVGKKILRKPPKKRIPKPRPDKAQKLNTKEQKVVDALNQRGRKSDKKIREQLGMTQGQILKVSNDARKKLGLPSGAKFKKPAVPKKAPPKSKASPFTDKEAKAYGKKNWDTFGTSLDSQEIRGVDFYIGNGHDKINAQLRAGKKLSGSSAKAKGLVDDAFKKAPTLGQDIVAFRGVENTKWLGNLDDLVGATIKDKGFMSTSLSKKSAERFATGEGNAAVFRIDIPAKTKGIWADSIAPSGESELILNRGTSIRVTKIVRHEGKATEIFAEVI